MPSQGSFNIPDPSTSSAKVYRKQRPHPRSLFTFASSADMSNTSSSNEPRNLLVVALVVVLMCGSVEGTRFVKLTADAPPAPVPWWKHPPPPPLHIQWPPPVHHYVRHPPSPPPPPPVDDDDSSPPPPPPPPHTSRFRQSPPPPPPPDEDRTPNERRLFSSDEKVADSGRNQLLIHTEISSSGKSICGGALSPGAAPGTGIPNGGGGYAPVGAPYSSNYPGTVMSPVSPPASAPAPALSSGADHGSNVEPASPPGNNGTLSHTTMYNQCTYTIVTSTGDIDGAGTQADVNVEFFDKFGSSVLFVKLRSQNRNFDQGTTDTFTVVGDCVQNICKMHLSHDDGGPNPGWFVNTVTVSVLYQTHVFNVFEWLAKDEPPYSLSRIVSSCPV